MITNIQKTIFFEKVFRLYIPLFICFLFISFFMITLINLFQDNSFYIEKNTKIIIFSCSFITSICTLFFVDNFLCSKKISIKTRNYLNKNNVISLNQINIKNLTLFDLTVKLIELRIIENDSENKRDIRYCFIEK